MLDDLIQEMYDLRTQKQALAEQTSVVNDRLEYLKRALVHQMNEQGVVSVKSPVARVVLTERQGVKTENWDSFCQYIKENDAFHLLTKSPCKTACCEFKTITGDLPPGISIYTYNDITFSLTRKP